MKNIDLDIKKMIPVNIIQPVGENGHTMIGQWSVLDKTAWILVREYLNA